MNSNKIIWLSANKFGYELLKEATKLENHQIAGIVTLSKNAKTVMYDGIDSKYWSEFNLPVYEIENVSNKLDLFKRLAPDMIVMCGWRQIIPGDILRLPRAGIIGFHPTLLPYGRGPAPIINTLLNGNTYSGLTCFQVGEGLDDGDIFCQEKFTIDSSDHAGDIYEKVIKAGRQIIKNKYLDIVNGKIKPFAQDNIVATYFPKRLISENEIKIGVDNIQMIYNKIRAFSKPYNGAFIKEGKSMLKIWKAELC